MSKNIEKTEDRAPCFSGAVNELSDTLDILLHEEIGFWGTQSKEFTELLNNNKDRIVNIDINSPGGSVFDGFAIYNALKDRKAPVNIKISGVAASIASVIAMAGDSKPEMPENTLMMIHKPMVFAGGNVDDLKEQIDVLDKMQNSIIKAYKRHSSESDKSINKMVNKTTWMSSAEAENLGFASEIKEEIEISNMYDFSAYNYAEIPEEISNRYKSKEKEVEKTLLNKTIELLNPIKKEPTAMDKKEFENKIDGLEILNKELTSVNEGLTKDVTALKEENKALKTDLDAKNVESAEKEVDSFLADCVAKGCILPVAVEDAKKVLTALEGTDAFEIHKESLKNAKAIDLKAEVVANKDNADNSGIDEKLDAAINKVMESNKNLTYSQALSQAISDNSELNVEKEEE